MVFHVFEATVPPPPRPNNKAIRGYYTRRVLSDAVKQVIFGAMTVTEAAQHFKIPRTTIQKHEAWPTESNEECAATHWRQQPVRLDPSPPRLFDSAQCSLEDDMIVAEQCEVIVCFS
ncbi:hypothetical protein ANCDUO_05836 [Ancylostoma duodenale]|uniref:HTH psq-type domain-containing protein n=1 Tax=Ancylostoma duodenale TaxID=51022 RepID=A0A0C2GXU5_9BILA|nr:hypothetical protein ANCDUO_05836 [Ancylostoma duodenale]